MDELSSSTKDWINSLLNKIDNQEFENCTEVISVEIKPLSDQIIIIVSDIFRLDITLKYKNGKTKILKLILKKEPTKEGFDKLAGDLNLTNTEVMAYNTILKPMGKLLRSKGNDILWPECYLSEDKCLLLKDLCVENYKIFPTSSDLLDVKHAKLAMKAIGQFHGMSLVLKEQGKIDLNNIPESLMTKSIDMFDKLYSSCLQQLANVAEKEWGPEWHFVGEKLRIAAENVNDKLSHLVISTRGKCSVLVHGDYTIRNIIFKYDDSHQQINPIDVKMFDFQGVCWENLGLDLVTLLTASLLPQIRENNLNDLLKTYSKSLSETCHKYNYNGHVPTFEDIRQALDSLGYFVLVNTIFAVTALMGAAHDFNPSALIDGSEDSPYKSSYFKLKNVQSAIQFQLKLSLKQHIL